MGGSRHRASTEREDLTMDELKRLLENALHADEDGKGDVASWSPIEWEDEDQ
jgi:hypothetical protein